MKILEGVLLVFLFALLGAGIYLFIYFFNPLAETENYQNFDANIESYSNLSAESQQFYPNMRYLDNDIGYLIESQCDYNKKTEMEDAFEILSSKTALKFHESDDPEIIIYCSNLAPDSNEKGHFVAGEGGPSEIINNSIYSIILLGKISLYKTDNCKEPKIAIHELFHALGFDHNSNQKSIMYPITNCEQQIDLEIIKDINQIYSIPSLPDLVITKLSANVTGKYLAFDIVIANIGFKDSKQSSLRIYSDSTEIKNFELNDIEFGKKKIISVNNLFISKNINNLKFEIQTNEQEISKENNLAEISLSS